MKDINSSDNMILITQLREQIESLKKQLQGKDAQLLEKDKKVGFISWAVAHIHKKIV